MLVIQCSWALVITTTLLSFNRVSGGVLGHNPAALRIQTKAAAALSSRDSVSRSSGAGSGGCPWGLFGTTACKEPNLVGCGGGSTAAGSSSFGNVARGGALYVATSFRGGASANEDSEDEYDDDEYDDEEEEEEEEEEEDDDALSDTEEEEYDDYDEEEEEEEEDETVPAAEASSASDFTVTTDYDEPLVPSPFQQMGTTIGIMMLCRKIDLFDPKVIKLARFAFIAYLVTTQLFLLYVRAKARSLNDRTPITIKNPISSVIQSQLPTGGSSGGNTDMVKNLANQFLSSQSTIMEYDLKQAKSMSGSTLFPMVFLWFIHFKMGQVQPLFYQTASGVVNLVYSPLFQVYVLGRNLERPFKSSNKQNVALEAMQKRAAAARQEAGDEEEEGDVKVSTTEKVGEEIGEEETEVDVDDVSSDDEEEDEEEGDEYDDYDYSEEED